MNMGASISGLIIVARIAFGSDPASSAPQLAPQSQSVSIVQPAPKRPGAIDLSFRPNLPYTTSAPFARRNGNVLASFDDRTLKELNPQGEVVVIYAGETDFIGDLIEQPDGKLLVLTRKTLHRYLVNGELDIAFNAELPSETIFHRVAWQAPGKILVITSRLASNGPQPTVLLRLGDNGELDESFRMVVGTNANFEALFVLKDSSILLGGRSVADQPIIKLHPDGTADSSFPPRPHDGARLALEAIQSDGRIIISGVVKKDASLRTETRQYVRLHPDGSPDDTFRLQIERDGVLSGGICLDGNDNIVLAGEFEKVNGIVRRHLARATRNGELDLSFDAKLGPYNSMIKAVVSGGSLYVIPSKTGGTPSLWDGVPVTPITRVILDLRSENPSFEGNRFRLAVPTTIGVTYIVEATSSVQNRDWQPAGEISGDGTLRSWTEDRVLDAGHFYRIRAATAESP